MITFPIIDGYPPKGWNQLKESIEHIAGEPFGVLTQPWTGIFVVDVDMKDGKDGLANLARLGSLPDTFTVKTKSGGYHFYFKRPDDRPIPTSAGKIAQGVDIRGDKNGYVVGPGSPGYEVIQDIELAHPPEWLLAEIAKEPVREAEPANVVPISSEHPEYKRRVELAKEYLALIPPCIQGESGSQQMMSVANHLMVRLELPLMTAEGLVHTFYNERCEPPWSGKEVRHKLTEAAKNELGLPSGVAPEGWSLRKEPPRIEGRPERRRRRTRPYSFQVGEPATGKARKATLAEVVADLCQLEDWAGVWQFDEFTGKVFAIDAPAGLDAETTGLSDGDITTMQCFFEVRLDKLVSTEQMYKAVLKAAQTIRFHQVRDYLTNLQPVEPEYIQDWARQVFGRLEDIEVQFVKNMLVSAIARVFQPGCLVKSMLVLTGPQNARKSSFCRHLFGKWFKEDLSDIQTKDAKGDLIGQWGIELAEMHTIRKAEINQMKSFVSTCTDRLRLPYDKVQSEHPRQCIFVSTTNEEQFLRDSTGSTRFEPIRITEQISLDWNRDEIWSAAYQAYLRGDKWWQDDDLSIEKAKRVKAEYEEIDPLTDKVLRYIATKDRVNITQICESIFQNVSDLHSGNANRVGAILRRLGLGRIQGTDGKRHWIVPDRYKTKLKAT